MAELLEFQKYIGVMVDLETLSTKSNACIVSIGACKFDFRESVILDMFKVNIDPVSCKGYGLKIDKDTVNWWSKQSKEAIDSWKIDPIDLKTALINFNHWWDDTEGKKYFWCNGMSFDSPILSNAYYATQIPKPWTYGREMDLRTTFSLIGFDLNAARRKSESTHHDSLQDAVEQTKYLLDFFGVDAFRKSC
jgi:hypothetical protein